MQATIRKYLLNISHFMYNKYISCDIAVLLQWLQCITMLSKYKRSKKIHMWNRSESYTPKTFYKNWCCRDIRDEVALNELKMRVKGIYYKKKYTTRDRTTLNSNSCTTHIRQLMFCSVTRLISFYKWVAVIPLL